MLTNLSLCIMELCVGSHEAYVATSINIFTGDMVEEHIWRNGSSQGAHFIIIFKEFFI